MPFTIIRQDITKMPVDAIVNTTNPDLTMGAGVCGAIFQAAGAQLMQAACDRLAPIRTGDAVITPGFALPAKYVIHAVGPVYRDGQHGEEAQLRTCYANALKRATEYGCKSVAFPLISSGLFGYPKEDALRVATAVIQEHLVKHDVDVTLVVYDSASFAVSEKLLGEVKAFIDENYTGDFQDSQRRRERLRRESEAHYFDASIALDAMSDEVLELAQDPPSHSKEPAPYASTLSPKPTPDAPAHSAKQASSPPLPLSPQPKQASAPMPMNCAAPSPSTNLSELMKQLDEPFSRTLLKWIDRKGKTDVEIYKRANIDRKLFSKIRSVKGYMPSKRTAVALAIALELTLEETADLLERAGYALSRSQKFDVIVEYFIGGGKYDLFQINEVLFSYDQPLLGG